MLGQAALNRDWNFSLAEQQLHRAIDLDPDHAVYHQWLAILFGLEGKHDLSLKEMDKAHAADPNWPPLYMTDIFLAAIAGNFERANDASDRLLLVMPDWPSRNEQYAMNLWDQGNYSKAIAEWREAAVLERILTGCTWKMPVLKHSKQAGSPPMPAYACTPSLPEKASATKSRTSFRRVASLRRRVG